MSGQSDKTSGSTRNYAKRPSTLANRKAEFDRFMATGKYDESKSYFDKSGGFVVFNKDHNRIQANSLELEASKQLAQKGYKVYIESEKSYIYKDSKHDGFLYKSSMDIKTINTPGENTLKTAFEKAAKQNAETVVVRQNSIKADRAYIDAQIRKFKEKSPRRAVKKIKRVVVVGFDGNVHTHLL